VRRPPCAPVRGRIACLPVEGGQKGQGALGLSARGCGGALWLTGLIAWWLGAPQVRQAIHDGGFHAEADVSDRKLQKKVGSQEGPRGCSLRRATPHSSLAHPWPRAAWSLPALLALRTFPASLLGPPGRVREAQLAQFNYILVVGAEEEAQKSVSRAALSRASMPPLLLCPLASGAAGRG